MQYKKNGQHIYNEMSYTNEWKRKRMIILYEVYYKDDKQHRDENNKYWRKEENCVYYERKWYMT